MRLTLRCLFWSIAVATGVLTVGYSLAGFWRWAFFPIILGIFWLRQVRQKHAWLAPFFLVGFIGIAGKGVRMGLGAGWMLVGVVAALSAWDLHHFFDRLQLAQKNDSTKKLEYDHLRRLFLVDCVGLVLASLALTVKITIGFGTILFLAALAVGCLSRFIGSLRRESD